MPGMDRSRCDKPVATDFFGKGWMAVTQFGKRMMETVGIALLCALSSTGVHAAPDFNPAIRDAGRQESLQGQKGRRQDEERRSSYRREDSGDSQRAQRLSPEERQQLRRDIKDAGRSLYRSRP